MPDFLTPSQYFRLSGDRPRKRFGQHFLAQPATAERIVRSADLSLSDVAVEIGPGLGALTQFILPAVRRLHLIELDRDMAAHLEAVLREESSAALHLQDVMAFDFAELARIEAQRLVLLGNLPYNISSPLFFRLLEFFPAIGRGVFMVQKEVGERFAASPGGKSYGVLSVLLSIYGSVQPLFTVAPNQFHPPPKVESLVIRVDFAESAPAGSPPFAFLRALVSAAFQQRRKTLQNSLKGFGGLPAEELSKALAALEIDPRRRAETLSASEFVALGSALRDAAAKVR
jgi:16S rRNA (adenine1518-N6/adenine1519-N6)-dimethyltransferase